jgi:hypothetical protein
MSDDIAVRIRAVVVWPLGPQAAYFLKRAWMAARPDS